MNTWQEYQAFLPLLQRIEARYTRLLRLEEAYEAAEAEAQVFSADDVQVTRQALVASIRAEAQPVAGKVYYWLYPFYPGEFLQLLAALRSCGLFDTPPDDAAVRQRFLRFFQTVPLPERLALGQRLRQPHLIEQAETIRQKLNTRRRRLKTHFDTHFAN